jgi:hypothetical protein
MLQRTWRRGSLIDVYNNFNLFFIRLNWHQCKKLYEEKHGFLFSCMKLKIQAPRDLTVAWLAENCDEAVR